MEMVWKADDGELDHIVKSSQRMLRLNDQYENHPYVEEFTKKCNVMFVDGTYVLEGEVDTKFYLGDIWSIFQGDTLPNNASNFCREMLNCMKAWISLQNTLDLALNIDIIRQAHVLMMEDKKDFLEGEYIKSPVLACFCISQPY